MGKLKPEGILLLFVLATLSGCATLNSANDALRVPSNLPEIAAVPGVPFFPQEHYLCGPAALATVLQFSGADVTPDSLTPQVYTPALKGSLQLDLVGATRHAGRVPFRIDPSLTSLFEEVSAGNPVLVLQKIGLLEGEWHFAVVVGYDRLARQVTLRSGMVSALHMSIVQFDRSWAEGERWGIVTLVPDRIPASATETQYLKQIAALESIRPDTAHAAYLASLAHWPNSLIALMGLGNLAYAAGQYDQAAHYFLDASIAHSDSADAFNNLAQAYSRQGQKALAQAAIEKALALGGNHVAMYRKTRDEVQAAQSLQRSE